MSTNRDVTTRIVRSWLHEDAHEDADRILNLVLDEIDTTPQRRANWLARRLPPMNNNLVRVALVAAVLVVAVIVGANLFQQPSVGPSPSVEPSLSAAPSATASTPPRLDLIPTGILSAGTYEIDLAFPVRLTFTVPDGFEHGRGASDSVGIQGNPGGRGIEFQIASNVYPDPCHTFAGAATPPIGPAVDDLVTAMTTLVGFQSGPVEDVTIGGLPAKAFDLTNEIDRSTCDGESLATFTFADANDPSGVGTGERQRIYVMDVQGTRLMIMTYYFSNETGSTDATEAATLAAIVQSISFP
ncbi:MAG: hypothetical protein ABI864_05210 [Chloroflexota bacterium]